MPQRRWQRVPLVKKEHLLEALQLQPRMRQVQHIRIREMREYAFDCDIAHTQGRLEQPLRAIPMGADTLHPSVYFQINTRLGAHRDSARLYREQLVHRRGGESQVLLDETGNLLTYDATENEHGQIHTRFAQARSFLQISNRHSK